MWVCMYMIVCIRLCVNIVTGSVSTNEWKSVTSNNNNHNNKHHHHHNNNKCSSSNDDNNESNSNTNYKALKGIRTKSLNRR